jgi:hypothetical protein
MSEGRVLGSLASPFGEALIGHLVKVSLVS